MTHTSDKPEGITDYFASLMADMTPAATGFSAPVVNLNRRSFMQLLGIAGGGLVLGFSLKGPQAQAQEQGALAFNAYLQIRPDGKVIIQAPNPEIGQGVKTSMPMIVAEELDAAWDDVEVVQSPINAAAYGMQFAGGSRSIPQNWDTLRRAGASARAMLVAAAAARWNVPASELITADTAVHHRASGRSAAYGELADAAAKLEAPQTVSFKAVSDYKLLGKRISGVDNLKIVTGQALFGIDQVQDNLAYAVYEKCSATGGKVVSANLEHIKTLKGVKDAFILEGNGKTGELMPGVAIVADSTWAAFKAKKALQVEWDLSAASDESWADIKHQAMQLADRVPATALMESGDVTAAMTASGNKAVEGLYTHHFVAHAPLEPQNTLATWNTDGSIEIWSNTQMPGRAVTAVAGLLGIGEDKVTLHLIRAGGGFGRRLINDPVCEAAAIAQRVKGSVKLQWTREDDTSRDFFRVGGFHAMKGAVDSNGKLVAFEDHLISFTENGDAPVSGGALNQLGFPEGSCKNARLAQTLLPLQIQCGPWRAPGSNTIAWAQQSFLGELAAAAGRDQLEFLLEALAAMPEPNPQATSPAMNKHRAIATVKLAAEKAGWGKTLPAGRGMGVAFYYSHAGHVAQVAEVSVDDNKRISVHQITAVADVGPIVNLSGAEAMMQGSVVDALSTLAGQKITFENGVISPLNFDGYPLLRMNQVPPVEVHFIHSDNPPTGLGEPGIPPLAPAIGNAIFAASGQRPRTMPLSEEGYTLV